MSCSVNCEAKQMDGEATVDPGPNPFKGHPPGKQAVRGAVSALATPAGFWVAAPEGCGDVHLVPTTAPTPPASALRQSAVQRLLVGSSEAARICRDTWAQILEHPLWEKMQSSVKKILRFWFWAGSNPSWGLAGAQFPGWLSERVWICGSEVLLPLKLEVFYTLKAPNYKYY